MNDFLIPQLSDNGYRRPTAIDLFSGAGGLSFGLAQAGFDVKLGIDNDKHALQTYRANHDAVGLLADVREISGKELLTEANLNHVDLLAGGPSCQGFSTHGKRLADDPRNFLYVEFMRLVEDIQPTTVLMENVKGLLSAGKGIFRDEVFSRFHELGYKVDAKVLVATEFGVPQRRERVIFLATRLGTELKLPTPTHANPDSIEVSEGSASRYITVGDAISDLPLLGDNHSQQPIGYLKDPVNAFQRLMRRDSKELWNHVAKPLSPLAYSIVSQVRQGQGLRSLPPEKMPERFRRMRTISNGELRKDCTTLYHRLSMEKPAYTITCNFRNVSSGAFTHPIENRSLTPREAARLQSFPDSFRFLGSAIPRQIGNAVPPLLAKAVGISIFDHLAQAQEIAA